MGALRGGLLRCGLRRARPPYDEELADLLHGRAVELPADARQQPFARGAIVPEHAHLDEFVRRERDVDLVQHRRRETMVADGDDGIEVVRPGAKRPAACGLERWHDRRSSAPILLRARGAPSRGPALVTSPLNRAGKKHRFGKAWMHEHLNDPYVREATRRGYRSRAAFKLMELDERDRFLRPGIAVVDLGAAPGSWSQVLRERLGPKATIVAVDLLPFEPIAGVARLTVDVGQDAALAAIEAALAGQRADLVLSDMSPNLSGVDVVDQARSIALAELALHFASTHLRPGGDFVVKVFQGAGLDAFQRAVRESFGKAYLRKPKASRDRSREHYVVARGFLGSGADER